MISNIVLEAEQTFLGSMMLNADLAGDWIPRLEPEDFFLSQHALIWRTIRYLGGNNRPINALSIEDAIRKHGRDRELEDSTYLAGLPQTVVSIHQAGYYGELILKHSAYRKVDRLGADLQQLARDGQHENAQDIFQSVDAKLLKLQTVQASDLIPVKDRMSRYLEQLNVKSSRIKTGHAAFDEWSGGAGRGWLYVLAGRPSVGKTAKAVQMATRMAQQGEGAVLFWSMEMTYDALIDRAVSNATSINYKSFTRKELTPAETTLVKQAGTILTGYPIFVDDVSMATFGHIRAAATRYKRKYGRIAAIIVDYLTHMDIRVEQGMTYPKAVEDVCKRFKALAKELDCCVILLAQLNRDAEMEGKRPTMANLKDSGGIEQAADLIEILWRDGQDEKHEDGKDYAIVTASIVKGRLTGTRDFKYKFFGHYQRFEDYVTPKFEEPEVAKDDDGFFHTERPNAKRKDR